MGLVFGSTVLDSEVSSEHDEIQSHLAIVLCKQLVVLVTLQRIALVFFISHCGPRQAPCIHIGPTAHVSLFSSYTWWMGKLGRWVGLGRVVRWQDWCFHIN
ncbi:unnamed protein product [Camellia sinensis]